MNILLSVLWWLYTEFSSGDSSGPAWQRFCGCRHLMAGLGLLGGFTSSVWQAALVLAKIELLSLMWFVFFQLAGLGFCNQYSLRVLRGLEEEIQGLKF